MGGEDPSPTATHLGGTLELVRMGMGDLCRQLLGYVAAVVVLQMKTNGKTAAGTTPIAVGIVDIHMRTEVLA